MAAILKAHPPTGMVIPRHLSCPRKRPNATREAGPVGQACSATAKDAQGNVTRCVKAPLAPIHNATLSVFPHILALSDLSSAAGVCQHEGHCGYGRDRSAAVRHIAFYARYWHVLDAANG